MRRPLIPKARETWRPGQLALYREEVLAIGPRGELYLMPGDLAIHIVQQTDKAITNMLTGSGCAGY